MAVTAEYSHGQGSHHQPAVDGQRARQAAFRIGRRHTWLVRFLRFALPVAALAFLASFFISPKLVLPEGFDYSIAKTTIGRDGITMEKPTVTGTDGANRKYTLSADRAVQNLTEPDKVHLDNILAEIRVPGRGPVEIAAGSGDFDNGAGALNLMGGIVANSPDGYTLRFEDAEFDFDQQSMKTGKSVEIIIQDSTTTGDSMRAAEGGQVLIIEGNVRTTMMPPNRPDAPTVTKPEQAAGTKMPAPTGEGLQQ